MRYFFIGAFVCFLVSCLYADCENEIFLKEQREKIEGLSHNIDQMSASDTIIDPLKGIHQFEVVLLPFTDLEKEAFFKAVVSSFEKIGDIRFSKRNICRIEGGLPILCLSLMGDEHRGSINIFAEAEVLINHCRIGSQIWKLDFNGKKEVIFPEMQEDGVVFRKKQQYEEALGPMLLQEKMVEQFAKAYWEVNSVRPTFYFYSNLLADSEVASN